MRHCHGRNAATPKLMPRQLQPMRRSASIRTRLLLMAVACAIPPLLLAGWLEYQNYRNEEARLRDQMVDLARALTLAVDGELQSQVRGLQGLSTSRALHAGDLPRFREEAEQFLLHEPESTSVLVTDQSGQILLNTRVPAGQTLPKRASRKPVDEVYSTGRSYISDLFIGAISGVPALTVDVPVIEDGRILYTLGLGWRSSGFDALLRRQRLPDGAVISILDRNNTMVARIPNAERYIGKPGSETLQALMRTSAMEGSGETTTLEGFPVYTAFSRSELSGFAVAVGQPVEILLAPLSRTLLTALVLGLLALALSAALAAWMAARMSRPVQALASYARAVVLGDRDTVPPRGMMEVEDVAQDIAASVAARRDADAQLRLVADAVPMIVAYVDRDYRYRFANAAYSSWFGLQPSEVIGRHVAEVIGTAAFDSVEPHMREALAGRSVGYETWTVYRGGQRRYIHATYVPHLGSSGEVLGFFSATADLTERRTAEERQILLAREVDHRAKNLLTVVQSVLRLTKAPDYASFLAAAEGRIDALARAHTLLASSRWAGIELHALVSAELAPFREEDGHSRIATDGPDLLLLPDAAQVVAIVVHELATNAAKYGALSTAGGRLDVTWRRQGDEVVLRWRERDGPQVETPSHSGFGSMILQASVTQQLDGSVRLDWSPDGLTVELSMPARHVARAAPKVA